MNMKSILLASAAAVVATSAFAADAMKPEAAPVAANYVKVCDTFGAGYFYIPGGDTCLKISGRVRFGVNYVTSPHAGTAFTDGRVAFDTAQATDGFGTAKSSIRFDYSGKTNTSVSVGEANLTLGDFFVGYNHGEIYQFVDFEGVGYDDTGVNTLGAASARFQLDDNGGTAIGAQHDFGGGWSAGAEVVGGSSGSYVFTSSSSTKPVIEAEVVYSSGALTASLGGVYDTATKVTNTQGGYAVLGELGYKFNDALTGKAGISYAKSGVDNGLTYINAGLGYTITPKWAVYTNAFYSFGNTAAAVTAAGLTDYRVAAEAGVTYTISTNFTANLEEAYSRPTVGSNTWTTLFKLARAF